jgi:hypothetical protein
MIDEIITNTRKSESSLEETWGYCAELDHVEENNGMILTSMKDGRQIADCSYAQNGKCGLSKSLINCPYN